jgi:hypothetical protein
MALLDNLFGTPPEYLSGLLGQDELGGLQRKANTTGLINTALAFIAQPRNQRYGSVLPYLGKALMAGQQSGQNVYENALRGFETQQKVADLKRQQELRQRQQDYIQTLPENVRSAAAAFPELASQYAKTSVIKDIDWKDTGAQLIAIDKNSGLPIEGLKPISKELSPNEQRNAQWEQFKFANPSAAEKLSAETSRQGQAITLRGQDLTNARALENAAIQNQLKDLQAQKLQSDLNQVQTSKQGASDSYDTAISSLNRLKKHPGLSVAVGASIQPDIPFYGTVPGTDKADFNAELDTFKSQTFLPMVQNLKGMGALSDAEGKKLTDAVGALNTNMSEKAFKESLLRIEADLRKAKKRIGINKKTNIQSNTIEVDY